MNTHVVALPRGLSRLALDDLPRVPWRNGAGWTRPVADATEAGHTLWRVSLAEITQAAPFSLFEGMDRVATLAGGGPVTFVGPSHEWHLDALGDQARFPGEWHLVNSAPASDALIWNVMTRRDAVEARVNVVTAGAVVIPAQKTSLVWVCAGEASITGRGVSPGMTLSDQEGLHCTNMDQPLILNVIGIGAKLIVTELIY